MSDQPFDPMPTPEDDSPESDLEREQIRLYAQFIAKLLDTVLYIPGTSIRIGLDPLLGLIPGIGDVLANAMGSLLLFLATRLNVPKIVLVRMALNIMLNTVIGAIPSIGDLFSIWFQSNVRNAALLRRYSARARPTSTALDWFFVIGLILVLLTVVSGIIFAVGWWVG